MKISVLTLSYFNTVLNQLAVRINGFIYTVVKQKRASIPILESVYKLNILEHNNGFKSGT